ncbi:elevenin-like [Liolophura sinensis]|uniref:elevenin-like n=1 Tax=Liolophura sinensis TaxID=3198878 RepID=UPI0031584AA9
MSKIADVAVAFALVILLSSYTGARRRRVDCTKFVFAPVCRGIAAKRGDTHLQISHTLGNPQRRLRLPFSSQEYNFDSPSLKEPMSLSKILMILSKIDTEKDLGRGRVQLHSSREQDRIAEPDARDKLLLSDDRWLQN